MCALTDILPSQIYYLTKNMIYKLFDKNMIYKLVFTMYFTERVEIKELKY